MIGFLINRVLLALLTIWAVSVLSFVIIQLPPGDILDTIQLLSLGVGGANFGNEELSDEEIEVLRREFGMDRPQYMQYLFWVKRMLGGNFGWSYKFDLPISTLLGERLLLTIGLSGMTIVFTWIMAVPIGIYSAVRQHSFGDYTVTFIGFVGLAIPDFLLGLVLMYIAFKYFGWSVGGLFSPEYREAAWDLARVWDLSKHLWIPAVVLGTAGTAFLVRVMRANLLDELGKPYVITARSKGLKSWRLILKYPVRVALNPLVSIVGYLLPQLIGGSVIVSVVLSLPTLGPLLLAALLDQDVFLAGTVVLSLGILTVVGTLVSDILLSIVDPRIRMTRAIER